MSDLLVNLDSPVSERVLVMHLLNGLSDKFNSIINVIKHKSPFPGFNEARSMLSMEEDRLNKQVKSTLGHNNASSPAISYTSSDQQHNRSSYNNTGGFSNNNNGYNRGARGRGRGRGGRGRGRGRYNNNNWVSPFFNNWRYNSPQWPTPFIPSPSHYPSAPIYPTDPNNAFLAHNNNMMQHGILGPPPSKPNTEAHVSHVSSTTPQATLNTFLPDNLTHAFNTMALRTLATRCGTWILVRRTTSHPIQDLLTRTKLLRCNSPGPLYSVSSTSPSSCFSYFSE